MEFGADLVMHSASKYLGGHADLIMGVLATSHPKLFKELKTLQRNRGATPSPFDCYLLERSLQTLEVKEPHISFTYYLWLEIECVKKVQIINRECKGINHKLLDTNISFKDKTNLEKKFL